MEEKYILELKNITKVFPGVKALKEVHLNVKEGEVHSLVGENGAGKSTLMKIISGAQGYTTGNMYFKGEEVIFNSTKEAQAHGISMIYQEFNLIPQLTVAENIFLGQIPKKNGLISWKTMNENAKRILDKLEIDIDPEEVISNLSVAHMQMVEIAKSLTHDSKVIIMDEPTAALTDEEIKTLFKLISVLKTRGISILYISHRMEEIFSISDRITVFRDGKYIKTMDKDETNYEEVVSLMVGQKIGTIYPDRDHVNTEVVLEVRNFTGESVRDVSFNLHKGEILGISGLLGAGNIDLSKMIYNAKTRTSGTLVYKGKELNTKTPKDSIKAGIGLVPDDRKNEGLVLIRSVKENISLSSLNKIIESGIVRKEKESTNVNNMIENLNIRVSNPEQIVMNLSGGNQQKVVFAKILSAVPELLILLEPTRGVDIGAKIEIYNIIDKLTEEGKSIILVSSDLPEVIGLCDRVLVMREGEIVKEIRKSEATQELILAYAAGGVSE